MESAIIRTSWLISFQTKFVRTASNQPGVQDPGLKKCWRFTIQCDVFPKQNTHPIPWSFRYRSARNFARSSFPARIRIRFMETGISRFDYHEQLTYWSPFKDGVRCRRLCANQRRYSSHSRSRQPSQVLRHVDSEHPLQLLAREVRSAFNTREFRAILLSAFNWRSAHRLKPKSAPPQNLSSTQSRNCTSKKRPYVVQNNAEFIRNFMTFIKSMNKEQQMEVQEKVDTIKKQQARMREHLDMFNAGQRLPGSYGSRQ